MTKVYRVLQDARYQQLELADPDALSEEMQEAWMFPGPSLIDVWEPAEVYVREPMLKKPDVWKLHTTLAFEPHVIPYVENFLNQSAERFELPFEDRILTVMNVTYVIDCLDRKKSRFNEDVPEILEEYAFHENRLDYSLFKMPETRHAAILTVQGLAGDEDEFKSVIDKYGFKGLQFLEIWSSE